MLSDDELVEQILLGNENAAEELIKRYYTSILRYCRWHCSNLDIVHEYNDIVRLEDRAEINYFLNFLSSEQMEAVILRFGEQLSFGEIAKVMGCNMRTAQSRVRNALKIMRKEQENER